MLHNTTQCPQPRLEPGLFNPEVKTTLCVKAWKQQKFYLFSSLPKYFMQLIYIWFPFKQWFSVIKFCHDTPNTPNVHSCGITTLKENFWSSVPQCYNLKQVEKVHACMARKTCKKQEKCYVLTMQLYSIFGNTRA